MEIQTNNIFSMKEMLYEVRCLKSNEDMILALAGQFKRLSHEPEFFTISIRIIVDFTKSQVNTHWKDTPRVSISAVRDFVPPHIVIA